jgi:hypothetical protein
MSVKPNNRGGRGWSEPFVFDGETVKMNWGGRQQGKTDAQADMIFRALRDGTIDASMLSMMINSGNISQPVLDSLSRKLGMNAAPAPPVCEDEIVMIEIDGVWMSPADAHEARLAVGRH